MIQKRREVFDWRAKRKLLWQSLSLRHPLGGSLLMILLFPLELLLALVGVLLVLLPVPGDADARVRRGALVWKW